jgi:hypothetical protein
MAPQRRPPREQFRVITVQLTKDQCWTILNALSKEAQTCRSILKSCGPRLAKTIESQVRDYERLSEIIENADSIEVLP